MLAKQSLFATHRHLTAVPYLEEAIALSEDPKAGFKSGTFVKHVIISVRTMLADCYYKTRTLRRRRGYRHDGRRGLQGAPYSCP
jgi:hypothetical protein